MFDQRSANPINLSLHTLIAKKSQWTVVHECALVSKFSSFSKKHFIFSWIEKKIFSIFFLNMVEKWQFDLNKILRSPVAWKIFYHFVIFGAALQYVWMVIWLLVKSSYTWTDFWWLIAILVIAQASIFSGLVLIFVCSQLAHARNVLIPVTRFWRMHGVKIWFMVWEWWLRKKSPTNS